MESMIYQMFGTTDGAQILVMLLTRVFIMLTILPVHEFAHGWAAGKLGDDTAKRMGRLTLNPFRHIHWLGSLMLLFFGFGFAKPVPVNPYKFKNQEKRRVGMALTALAGPCSNLILAFIAVIAFCGICCVSPSAYYYLISDAAYSYFYPSPDIWSYIGMFLMQFSIINISLAVFNLLPIPPLDGSRIFGLLFPEKLMNQLERYAPAFIVVVLLLVNRVAGVGNALGALTTRVFIWLNNAVAWFFGLFGAELISFV